jgi:transcriptional regulator with XRE-family HTH domain
MMVGMSQEALGDKLNLTFQQIQKYEKGANRIGAGRLYEISRILNTPVSSFFDGIDASYPDLKPNGHDPEADSLLDFVGSPEGLQLNRAFAQISDSSTRRRIVDLVQTLTREAS